MSIIKDIEVIVQKITEFMIASKIDDLIGSIRTGVWRDLCIIINNVENFSEQSRLYRLWNSKNRILKNKVLNNLNIAKNNKEQKIVTFSLFEWQKLIEEATNPAKVKFLVDFDNVLSEKLQKQGIKCWLRCANNYFGKKQFWTGKFFCIEKSCGIKYDAFGLKQKESIDIFVSFDSKTIDHEIIIKQLRVSGEQRIIQQKSLLSNGICNTQSFNDIYNSCITDPSKSTFLIENTRLKIKNPSKKIKLKKMIIISPL
jgi:hypothetical protein